MKLFSVATLLAAVASTAHALTIGTPTNVVQCQPLLITWDPQGSAGPFSLNVENPSGGPLFSWTGLTGTSFTWVVAVAAGQSLVLVLGDTTGATALSSLFTVLPGSDASCLTSSGPPGSSSSHIPITLTLTTTTSSTTTSSITTSSVTTSSTPTNPTESLAGVSFTSISSPTSSPTGSSSGGALGNAVGFGSAGFLAALVGAILA